MAIEIVKAAYVPPALDPHGPTEHDLKVVIVKMLVDRIKELG